MIATRSLVLLLCVNLLAATPVVAQTATSGVDPRAEALIRDMSDYLKSFREFSFRTEVTYDRVLESGQKIQYARQAEISIRRPDKLHVLIDGDLIDERMWYDGKTFVLMNLRNLEFAKVDVPDNIDETLDLMARSYGVSSPVADVLYSDPYAVLTENLTTGSYVGRSVVRGVPTHHLAFTQSNIDWQIWIEDGAHPVPRKAVITYKNVTSSPQFYVWLSNWNFAPALAESMFRFLPPDGAREVELEPIEQ